MNAETSETIYIAYNYSIDIIFVVVGAFIMKGRK